VGRADQTHALGGLTLPRMSRSGRGRLRRFHTIYPVCFGLSRISRTLLAVQAPTRRRPCPRIGSGGGATLPVVAFAEIGFAVAFGVLLDTIIVRSVLVTALNLDLGPHVWWPNRLSKMHDVAPAEAPDWSAPPPETSDKAALSRRQPRRAPRRTSRVRGPGPVRPLRTSTSGLVCGRTRSRRLCSPDRSALGCCWSDGKGGHETIGQF
jgi:hypothetical protein